MLLLLCNLLFSVGKLLAQFHEGLELRFLPTTAAHHHAVTGTCCSSELETIARLIAAPPGTCVAPGTNSVRFNVDIKCEHAPDGKHKTTPEASPCL